MIERFKRWESPRKQGRNDKGKGGTARARQLRKREQMLRQKLKSNSSSKPEKFKPQEREIIPSLFYWQYCLFSGIFFQLYASAQKYYEPIEMCK
jgi:hypothetical protein